MAFFFASTPPPEVGIRVRSLRQHAWELPILGKYYFGNVEDRWRFFAGGGVSLATGTEALTAPILDFSDAAEGGLPVVTGETRRFERRIRTDAGAVAGAGLMWQKGRFGLAPEFRYTHWGRRHIHLPKNQVTSCLPSGSSGATPRLGRTRPEE